MLSAIIIDDEKPAIEELAYLLSKYPEIKIIGKYINPVLALDQLACLKPDVIFLDINMPHMQGIDAISPIKEFLPEADVVFVTAYDEFAVKAFEVNAFDYILKPVSEARLSVTIERLLKRNTAPARTEGSELLQIKCLGDPLVFWTGSEPIKWRTDKTKELFFYLLHNAGRNYLKEKVLDDLWPVEDPEKSIRQLYNGVYYIRRALKKYGVNESLLRINSNYTMKKGPVYCDADVFMDIVTSQNCTQSSLEKAEEIYKGDYMQGYDYLWAVPRREKLSKLYEKCLMSLSKIYTEKKLLSKAENTLHKAYDNNPYDETITRKLLEIYKMTGQRSKAAMHYRAYTYLLKEDLGIEPHESLEKLCLSI